MISTPLKILHGFRISRLPNHEIALKVGTPIVLLRTLDSALGLCNGTFLIIEQLGQKILDAQIIKGRNIGQKILILCVDIMLSTKDVPFVFKHRRFLIKFAFAMAINKSQGLSLIHI